MTEDSTARRQALIDDIAAKGQTLMAMSRQAGPDGRQLSDVLADAAQSEPDTEPAVQTDQPPAAPTTPEPAPARRPQPDPGQGARGPVVDTSLVADLARKSEQLRHMAARGHI